uniref:Uncharacterized protein n=1 Tax=Triticum urartu TaxID=4572 RepID=A0A8R7PH28_TRIUA
MDFAPESPTAPRSWMQEHELPPPCCTHRSPSRRAARVPPPVRSPGHQSSHRRRALLIPSPGTAAGVSYLAALSPHLPDPPLPRRPPASCFSGAAAPSPASRTRRVQRSCFVDLDRPSRPSAAVDHLPKAQFAPAQLRSASRIRPQGQCAPPSRSPLPVGPTGLAHVVFFFLGTNLAFIQCFTDLQKNPPCSCI